VVAGARLVMFVVASVVAGVLVAGLALPVTGALGLVGREGAQSFESLPSELATPPLPQRSRILDAEGGLIAQFYYENRISVPLGKVSPAMRKAIVAIEDYRFYQHGGVDVRGTARAFVSNQSGESTQGGSTLTQQYVKLVQQESALARGDQEAARAAVVRTGTEGYARKLQEMRYAVALEEQLSKDQILERYLNIAYFGSGAYGVEAAARHYFRTSAAQLDLAQSALLAGLVQSPTALDPTVNPERARQRRDVVLARMAAPEVAVITPAEAAAAKALALGIDEAPVRNGCSSAAAPFFCDYVVNVLKDDPALGATREARERVLLRGGLTVRTTLDPDIQQGAQEAVDENIPRRDKSQFATTSVVVQPGTGNVLAMAQNRTWGKSDKRGYTQINYAVDKKHGGGIGFQGGSTFKVFTAAAAIEDGIPVTRRIDSPAARTFSGFENCTTGVDWPAFPIRNSTRSGVFDMRDGLAWSVNTWAVGLSEIITQCKVVDMAERLGVHRADGGEFDPTPNFTLGTPEVAPLSVAEAYAAFAARGKHCAAHPILEISDGGGRKIPVTRPQCRQAIEPEVADAVNSLTQGVVDFGTGQAMRLDRPTAGKTGTTQSNKDVWFAGYTPNMAAAVWVGDPGRYRDGQIVRREMRNVVIGGQSISAAAGSTVAGPIWKDTMEVAVRDLPKESFVAPQGAAVAPDPGTSAGVPDVRGESREAAVAALEAAGLSWRIAPQRVRSDSVDEGDVAYTTPTGGTSAADDEQVTVYLSGGEDAPEGPQEDEDAPAEDGQGGGGDADQVGDEGSDSDSGDGDGR
jgi:membrane peptidoglycan carboxypeptidase